MKAICLLVVGATAFISSAHAGTFNYVCNDRGKLYPLKVDDKQNTLTWKGSTYNIKQTIPDEAGCAKYGWHAEKDGAASFNFCTATKGYGAIERNEGPDIACNLKR